MMIHDVLRNVRDPLVVLNRVAEQAIVAIPGADGAVVGLLDDGELAYVCGSGTLESHVGMRLDVPGSFAGQAMRDRATLHCADAATDPRVDREHCRRLGAISMICVPLEQRNQPVGALIVSASRSNAFLDCDVSTLSALAEFISATVGSAFDLARIVTDASMPISNAAYRSSLGGSSATTGLPTVWPSNVSEFMVNMLDPGSGRDVQRAQRIRGVLDESDFETVYQPIVELATRTIVGAEALTRFPGPAAVGPSCWFKEAHLVGFGDELELATIARALASIDAMPVGMYLSVNVGPQTITTLELRRLLSDVDGRRVVLELTEHEGDLDYDGVRTSLRWIRDQGIRLAIDDTGSGFATLTHIVNLAPDIIKLDREIISGIDIDPVRRSLVGALMLFAAETGADVTAEGIETRGELDVVVDLGVACGQGYLLGHPGTVSELHAWSNRQDSPISPFATSGAAERLGREHDGSRGFESGRGS